MMELRSAETMADGWAVRRVVYLAAMKADLRAAMLGLKWAEKMVAMMAAMMEHHSADLLVELLAEMSAASWAAMLVGQKVEKRAAS